jgi:hypothetical protein
MVDSLEKTEYFVEQGIDIDIRDNIGLTALGYLHKEQQEIFEYLTQKVGIGETRKVAIGDSIYGGFVFYIDGNGGGLVAAPINTGHSRGSLSADWFIDEELSNDPYD